MVKSMAVSSDEIIAVLFKSGFGQAPRKGKGNHRAIYRKDQDGQIKIVIVPKLEKMPQGVLNAILEQAGMSLDKFSNLLKSP